MEQLSKPAKAGIIGGVVIMVVFALFFLATRDNEDVPVNVQARNEQAAKDAQLKAEAQARQEAARQSVQSTSANNQADPLANEVLNFLPTLILISVLGFVASIFIRILK